MDRSTILERSERTALRFGALADPARLAIVDRLRAGTRCVCDLRDDLGLASNLLSYHLRILRRAGLVRGTRRGRRVEYRLVADALEAVRRDFEALTPAATT
ncbi:MAG TPA: metalloregulator ArsR/SmtB family transcription factor [Actinomycetota bacterium]